MGELLSELHSKFEDATVPYCVFWTEYDGVPEEDVVAVGGGIDAGGRVVLKLCRFFFGGGRGRVGAVRIVNWVTFWGVE